jgi:hypothetical protein
MFTFLSHSFAEKIGAERANSRIVALKTLRVITIPEFIYPFLSTRERIISEAMTWERPLVEPALDTDLATAHRNAD